MPSRSESLPAVTAAAVVAIIFSAFGVLGGLLIEISTLLMPDVETSAGRPAMPPGARSMAAIVWLFLAALIGLLLSYRSRFLEAASAAKS
jgi:hypothetical protein